MPLGKKICPNCKKELGVRTGICPDCQHDFSKKKIIISPNKETVDSNKKEEIKRIKVVKEDLEEKKHIRDPYSTPDDEVIARPGKNVTNYTGEEHADRILAMGERKARSLLMAHNTGNTWSHVNWKYLEEKLNEQR